MAERVDAFIEPGSRAPRGVAAYIGGECTRRASRVNIGGGARCRRGGGIAVVALDHLRERRHSHSLCSRSAVTVSPASITACTISPSPWFHSYCPGDATGGPSV